MVREPDVPQIVLVRHGPPDCPAPAMMSAREFACWVASYHHAPLITSKGPRAYDAITTDNEAIVCSALLRARMSAEALYPGIPRIQESVLYNEAEVPTIRFPFLKLPAGVWAILARICWLCGYHPDIESVTTTRYRARQAAYTLSELAQNHGRVVLVGHGLMNYLIGWSLRKDGWIRVVNTGSGFWGRAEYKWLGKMS